eukprot:403364880
MDEQILQKLKALQLNSSKKEDGLDIDGSELLDIEDEEEKDSDEEDDSEEDDEDGEDDEDEEDTYNSQGNQMNSQQFQFLSKQLKTIQQKLNDPSKNYSPIDEFRLKMKVDLNSNLYHSSSIRILILDNRIKTSFSAVTNQNPFVSGNLYYGGNGFGSNQHQNPFNSTMSQNNQFRQY